MDQKGTREYYYRLLKDDVGRIICLQKIIRAKSEEVEIVCECDVKL